MPMRKSIIPGQFRRHKKLTLMRILRMQAKTMMLIRAVIAAKPRNNFQILTNRMILLLNKTIMIHKRNRKRMTIRMKERRARPPPLRPKKNNLKLKFKNQ